MAEAPEVRLCGQKQVLMDKVLKHLLRIADLSRATADALTRDDESRTRDLDKEVEEEIGAKERALGALRQHRHDHGC